MQAMVAKQVKQKIQQVLDVWGLIKLIRNTEIVFSSQDSTHKIDDRCVDDRRDARSRLRAPKYCADALSDVAIPSNP